MTIARKTLAALLVCACIIVEVAIGQTPKVKIDFTVTKLKNGLRVITVEDHSAPVVSQVLFFDVGAAHERPGRTGFAHLFEHMMFRGTENIKSMSEYLSLIRNNGGAMDAFTGADQTVYFEVVPANQLELPLFLESDRMRGLLITQEVFDTERKVVQEERRLRIDNQPYGKSGEVMGDLLYDNFAYKHKLMGSMEDLSAASVGDIKQFFKTYYAPNNVVLILVGDFKTSEAIAKVRKYFEDIPRQPAPPTLDRSEPEQKAERRRTVEDALARLPMVSIAFKALPGNTSDFYALQILASVLTTGQSSRLYQKLVKQQELASSLSGGISESRGVGALSVTTLLSPGKKTEDVERIIYEEIEWLRREPISDAELQKAKNIIALGLNTNLQTSLVRAITLGTYAVFYDDPNLINTRPDKIAAVTKQDVQRVANHYLRPTNRTVLITMPKAATSKAAQ